MTLDDFMTKHKIKNKDFARQTGFTDGFISKLRKFKSRPTIVNSVIISKACNFEVSVSELISQSYFNDQVQKHISNNPDCDVEKFNLIETLIQKVE